MPEPDDTDLFFTLLERIADALDEIAENSERIADALEAKNLQAVQGDVSTH